jgi:putative transposase
MARLPRIEIPGTPQHLIVRGNNRSQMFRDDADRCIFLGLLERALAECACDLHAYVLMSNHVHLLVTGHVPGELSNLIQRIGRKFARLVNLRWDRTGTLFEGRFRSSVVDSEAYLLTCMKYIELNPVRAGIVRHPGEFGWSSYRGNATGAPAAPLAPHDIYRALGATDEDRGSAYRDLVAAGLPEGDLTRIRESAKRCRALGRESFCAELEALLRRPVAPRPQGRPKRGQVEKLT